MADLAGETGHYELEHYGFSNTVEIRSDWLAPVNIDWNEIANVTLSDGRRIEGGLYVTYHEARSPAIARAIAEEYFRKDYYDQVFNMPYAHDFEPLELSPLNVEYATAYRNRVHHPTVVLQDGTRVLRAYWYQTSKDKLTLDEWAAILARSISED